MLKSKSIMKVEEKRNLLIAFSKKDPSCLFDNAFSELAEVASLFNFFKAAKRSSVINWNATLCAKKLLQLHAMIHSFETTELVKLRASQRGAASGPRHPITQDAHVKQLKKLVIDCMAHVVSNNEKEKNKATRRTRVQGGQGAGILQDQHAFDEGKRYPLPCPHCSHSMVMALESKEEIDALNQDIRDTHEKERNAWERAPPASRAGSKPKLKKTVCQTLVCYCGMSNCLMRMNGEGCSNCKNFRESGVDLTPVEDSNGGPGDFVCPCKICQCPCMKSFSANNVSSILLEIEMENRGISNKTNTTSDNNPSLVSEIIGSHLANGRITFMQTNGVSGYDTSSALGEQKLNQDILAFSSTQLASDPVLHANTAYCKSFQQAVGPLSNREVCPFRCTVCLLKVLLFISFMPTSPHII